MKIGVLVKQVPSGESPLPLAADGTWILEDQVTFIMNESDAYALEEALQIKEELGAGEVVVISLGPAERTVKTIREALAKGADRAIHLVDAVPGISDPFQMAQAFADRLKDEKFDLIFSGLQSGDLNEGQTGILLGELLGMATASLVVGTEIKDGHIRVKRELEGGWYQWVMLPLPAAISIQSGINQPRYASLKGIMTAKRKEILSVPVGELQIGDPLQHLSGLSIPQTDKETHMISGDTAQIVTQLMDVLKTKAKVI